jgi:hypothetical protein
MIFLTRSMLKDQTLNMREYHVVVQLGPGIRMSRVLRVIDPVTT